MTMGKRPASVDGGWASFVHTVQKSQKRRKMAFVDECPEAAEGKIVVVGIACVTTKMYNVQNLKTSSLRPCRS